MTGELFKTYKNGNYKVYILNDGTKIRCSNDDILIPDRVEAIDLTITERCLQMCQFCYANCTPSGKYAKLMNPNGTPAQSWITTIPPYTELAINGNDMDHPELIPFLIYCQDHNIIVNITVHQNQFINNFTFIKKLQRDKLINGIGVSISDPDKTLITLLKITKNVVCHVIAGIVTKYVMDMLADNDLNILILGYKEKGRGIAFHNIRPSYTYKLINELADNIISYTDKFKAISFDCLAVKQLNMKDKLSEEDWNKLYMGEDGTTTFFIDAVNEKFAKSSTETEYKDINGKSIDEMFNEITN